MRHLLLAIALCTATADAWAQRPEIVFPSDRDHIVERLPAGYAELMPTANSPAISPGAGTSRAARLLEAGARTGDMRLISRAEKLLESNPGKEGGADLLLLRAFSAQHRHDFREALRLLDERVARMPRDGNARLVRAEIHLVQGHIRQARSECAVLALGVDASSAQLCAAALSLRLGKHRTAIGLLDLWLQQAPRQDARRRYALVTRAVAASRNGDPDARLWFGRALELGPRDVRTLAALARHMRRNEEHEALVRMLSHGAIGDGLALQRALSAHAARLSESKTLVDAQARRYARVHAAGGEPELRDEAEFLLTLRNDPAAALELAQRNFRDQRDVEDVDVFVRAAIAAGRRDALQPLTAWAKSEGVPVPRLEAAR